MTLRSGERLLLFFGLAACAAPGPGARLESVVGGAGDPPAVRAARLVRQLTLAEKLSQLETASPAIPRLGIPAYDWWSESLHGVARAGTATVFPQVIGLAATFDEALVRRVAAAIAEEARAKYLAARGRDEGSGQYRGLTFFAPNINIFRDPRWGRGQETFGEDPLLTSRLAVAYVRGLQGDDPRTLTVAAVAKHFAVHSGPESARRGFDARVSAHDLAETYLPQFEAVVRAGRVAGIMAAYNRVNGEPCVSHATLLSGLLRGAWGFDGFVVGDCGAVADLEASDPAPRATGRAAARALRAGTDLDCGSSYRHLAGAVASGALSERELEPALVRLFTVRFRLGLLDPPPGAGATPRPLSSDGFRRLLEGHRELAREAARSSMVLLRNDGVLPLGPQVRRVALLGPTADDPEVLLGDYHGTPFAPVTLRAGLESEARRRGIDVTFLPGVRLTGRGGANLAGAEALARAADVAVVCLGLSPRLESEEGDPESDNPAGDRHDLELPGLQPALLRRVLAAGKPVVVVLTGGSALALPRGATPGAVLVAWYPGEQGGAALAELVFGTASPSGRLPITFYRDVRELPAFTDYRLRGRTYRYFTGDVAYPFGHGLGYAPVVERDVRARVTDEPPLAVRLDAIIENPGARAVERVVPVFAELVAREAREPSPIPLRSLVAFRRVGVPASSRTPVTFELGPAAFERVDEAGHRHLAPGAWRLHLGDAPPIELIVPARSTAPNP